MINQKYYQDIKNFPKQFKEGIEKAKEVKIDGEFNRIVVCGMGGSGWPADFVNDFLEAEDCSKLRLEVNRSYNLPKNVNEKTLFLVISYSGNSEETLSCLKEIEERGLKWIALTSGGKLLDKAKEKNMPLLQIPTGIQPRMATGYFISGMIKILANGGLSENKDEEMIKVSEKMDELFDEKEARTIAKELANNVPLIYATDNNKTLAKATKIKFNEDSKVQAFWNFFPELPHNEMEGFTNLVMKPYFLIFKSKFTNSRNYKRIDVFSKLMREKGLPVKILDLKGDSVFAEMMNAYYFVSHIAYYLAELNGTNPEPVVSVEGFKKLLEE